MLNRSTSTSKLLIAGSAVIAIVGLIVLGTWFYWVGEGKPGTPSDFRDQVAATGLVVEWSNNGPTGGDGLVTRDCGPLAVSVEEIDETLWLLWGERREILTSTSAQAFQACQLQ